MRIDNMHINTVVNFTIAIVIMILVLSHGFRPRSIGA